MYEKVTQIIGWWARTQLYGRQPEGEKASEELHKLMDSNTVQALFFITGFCGGVEKEGWKKLEKLAKRVRG